MTGSDLLQAIPIAIYTTDREGRITFYNEAAAELWGVRPALLSDKWCGSWRLYHADGRPLPHDECPMALALKEGRPIRGIEVIAERPDGRRVRLMPYPTPLRDAAGALTGAINILTDLTHQHADSVEAARLAAIVSSSDDAIISKTLDGRVTSWNTGAAQLFGYQADEMIGKPILTLIPPELHYQEDEILAKIRRGERIEHYETERVTKGGRRIAVSLTVSPIRDKLGTLIGASKIARDISERKKAEHLQKLLIQELNHRVKNMLATVQAIANQSLRHARNPAEFSTSFMGRVQAMARVHSLLTETSLQGAEVGKIVRDQVLLEAEQDERVSWSGPTLTLEPKAATHLALILHELGTNARKYGALSVPAGRLAIEWTMKTENGRRFYLLWQESGGPKVTAPATRGFGTTLIERSLQPHGGETSLRYAEHGLTCEIMLPLVDEGTFLVIDDPALWPIDNAPKPVEAAAAPSRLTGRRVLLVEDEAFVALDMQAVLMEAGCDVIGPAGSVAKAKSLIADTICDAALLDANLAGHPVDELAALLTKKSVPFAFVTGYGLQGLPAAFRDAPVLAKPFSPNELRALVGTLLNHDGSVIPLRRKTKTP